MTQAWKPNPYFDFEGGPLHGRSIVVPLANGLTAPERYSVARPGVEFEYEFVRTGMGANRGYYRYVEPDVSPIGWFEAVTYIGAIVVGVAVIAGLWFWVNGG